MFLFFFLIQKIITSSEHQAHSGSAVIQSPHVSFEIHGLPVNFSGAKKKKKYIYMYMCELSLKLELKNNRK